MLERFVHWLNQTISPKQAVVILAFCMLITAAFAFGAAMGQRSVFTHPQGQLPPGRDPAGQFAPPRGTFGAIDEIQGDVIEMRDPRTGRTWRVRAVENTVIEYGSRRRIPFDNLRVGQRIFVVGMPNGGEGGNEFDAQFIGVVLGQQQNYVRPVQFPSGCWDCAD